MLSIFELIQQKPPNLAVKDIVKYGKKNVKELEITVVQFFIDVFGKRYQIDAERYETMQESDEARRELLLDVYKSDTIQESSSSEVPLKEFLSRMLNELFIEELLNRSILEVWILFLSATVEHNEIPVKATMKGRAHLLLALMLEPLTNIIKIAENLNTAVEEEFKRAIFLAAQKIFNNISGSFGYEKFAYICAKEYVDTLKNNHEVFIKSTRNLEAFRKLLFYDNRETLVLGLKALRYLCQIESLKDIMREFLLSNTVNESNETIIQLILKMMSHKSLKVEALALLKTLSSLSEETPILSEQQKLEAFINIFSKNKKIATETAELMVELNVDFWHEIIKMLNYNVDEDVDLQILIQSIESAIEMSPKAILEIVTQHIKEPNTSRRAAELFNQSFSQSDKKTEFLMPIVEALNIINADETTFIIILKCLNEIDKVEMSIFLKKNPNCLIHKLIPYVSNAFVEFSKPLSMNIIVGTLMKLCKINHVLTLPRVRELTSGFYNKLQNLKTVEFSEREKLVPKLTALFECRSWKLLDNNVLLKLYAFCEKYCTNLNYTRFPQFQRLYVNILKQFWMMQLANVPINVPSEPLQKSIQNLFRLLKNALNGKWNTSEMCLIICSIIDLSIMFQPTMREKYEHAIFKNVKITLDKNEFRSLVDLIDTNVTRISHSDDEIFFQQMLTLHFVMLYKEHKSLPSLTSWETLLRSYNVKSPIKAEIEMLMMKAIEYGNNIFEKSVAFSILNIAAGSNLEFKAFHHALEEFMRKKFTEKRRRDVVFLVICSFALERMCKMLNDAENENGENRLKVLEYLSIIVKNMDLSIVKNLIKYVTVNEDNLSVEEMRQLEEFRNLITP